MSAAAARMPKPKVSAVVQLCTRVARLPAFAKSPSPRFTPGPVRGFG